MGFEFLGIDELGIVGDLAGLRVGDISKDVFLFRIDIAMLSFIPFRSVENLRKNQRGRDGIQGAALIEHIVVGIGAATESVRNILVGSPFG